MQEPPVRTRPWTEPRIHAELVVYLEGKPAWPTEAGFRAAGKNALRQAMTRSGGLEHWAARFPDIPCPQLHRWTEDEIRRQITEFCRHKNYFPTDAEFRNAHRVGLYRAMGTRGRDAWAAELRLPRARDRDNACGTAVAVP